MLKITVLTDTRGKVLGTQGGHGPIRDPLTGITAELVAGPGQQIHQIEIQEPRRLSTRRLSTAKDIEAFHAKVKEHLVKTKRR
jgi:hypothetical protein